MTLLNISVDLVLCTLKSIGGFMLFFFLISCRNYHHITEGERFVKTHKLENLEKSSSSKFIAFLGICEGFAWVKNRLSLTAKVRRGSSESQRSQQDDTSLESKDAIFYWFLFFFHLLQLQLQIHVRTCQLKGSSGFCEKLPLVKLSIS